MFLFFMSGHLKAMDWSLEKQGVFLLPEGAPIPTARVDEEYTDSEYTDEEYTDSEDTLDSDELLKSQAHRREYPTLSDIFTDSYTEEDLFCFWDNCTPKELKDYLIRITSSPLCYYYYTKHQLELFCDQDWDQEKNHVLYNEVDLEMNQEFIYNMSKEELIRILNCDPSQEWLITFFNCCNSIQFRIFFKNCNVEQLQLYCEEHERHRDNWYDDGPQGDGSSTGSD